MNKQLRQDSSSDKLLTYFEKKRNPKELFLFLVLKKRYHILMQNNNHIHVLHTKSPDKSNTKTNLTSVARKLLTNYLIYIILRRGITL